jgi:hypothetical protein
MLQYIIIFHISSYAGKPDLCSKIEGYFTRKWGVYTQNDLMGQIMNHFMVHKNRMEAKGFFRQGAPV